MQTLADLVPAQMSSITLPITLSTVIAAIVVAGGIALAAVLALVIAFRITRRLAERAAMLADDRAWQAEQDREEEDRRLKRGRWSEEGYEVKKSHGPW